jgi:hypothetical protein
MSGIPANERPLGRATFWLGIAACLLGPALAVAQFSLNYLIVPWYSPALATLGALLLLVSLARRRSVLRIAAFVVVAAFAGFQWVSLASLGLPAYEGPVRAGRQLPAFRTTLADGRPFTDADFRDGSRRVMVFFRGRW